MNKVTFLVGMKVINNFDRTMGIGVITKVVTQSRHIFVKFPTQKTEMGYVIESSGIRRVIVRPVDQCEYQDKGIKIKGKVTKLVSDEPDKLRIYDFKGEDGIQLQLREDQFHVLSGGYSEDPLANLCNLRLGSPKFFDARTNLLLAVETLHQKCRGIHSLLGARLITYPHQAFVVGTVLRNIKRRFMLADEVGLGKTIEAGLILFNLMQTGEVKRVLIIAPGALAHQWFCEMYIKFGKKVFTFMNEKRFSELGNNWINKDKVICSFEFLRVHGTKKLLVQDSNWDMLIVDESHQIGPVDPISTLIQEISKKTENVLVLSATPITGHEKQYLSVLTLLDPHLYDLRNLDKFKERLRLQKELSEMLVATEDAEPDQWLKNEWLKILPNDQYVMKLCETFFTDPETPNNLCSYISNYYKINRRIIRNRRQTGRIKLPERAVEVHTYELNATERSLHSELEILTKLYVGNPTDIVLGWISLIFHAASSSPFPLVHFLEERLKFIRGSVNKMGNDKNEFKGYDIFSQAFWKFSVFLGEEEQVRRCLLKAKLTADIWDNKDNAKLRWLVSFLNKNENDMNKFLLFSSFLETVKSLVHFLRSEYGEDAIAEFHHDQTDEERDKEALKFTKNRLCIVLVCDELGGEGRNFQFAKGIIHFDLPWEIFKVEQRIGRLDRLGRDEPVVSHLLVTEEWIDTAVANIYKNSLGIFSRTASGLEFAFDKISKIMASALISGGAERIYKVSEEIKIIVEKERESRSEDLILDRSSYNPDEDPDYENIVEVEEAEKLLRDAVCRWADVIGVSVKFNTDGPKTVSFRAKHAKLPLSGIYDDFIYLGTFKRKLATMREDLHFFSIGHELINALIEAAKSDVASSTTMIHRFSDQYFWKGFRILVSIHPDYKKLETYKIGNRLINELEFVSPPQVFEYFVRISEEGPVIEEDKLLIEYLRSVPTHGEIKMFSDEELSKLDMEFWDELCKGGVGCVWEYLNSKLQPYWEEIIHRETRKAKENIFLMEMAYRSIGGSNLGTSESELEEAKEARYTELEALKYPCMDVLAMAYYDVRKQAN